MPNTLNQIPAQAPQNPPMGAPTAAQAQQNLFKFYQQQYQQQMQNNQFATPANNNSQGGIGQSAFNSSSPNFTSGHQQVQPFPKSQRNQPSYAMQSSSKASNSSSGSKPVVQSKVVEIADQLGGVLQQPIVGLNMEALQSGEGGKSSVSQAMH
jgi:hypothetical protein